MTGIDMAPSVFVTGARVSRQRRERMRARLASAAIALFLTGFIFGVLSGAFIP